MTPEGETGGVTRALERLREREAESVRLAAASRGTAQQVAARAVQAFRQAAEIVEQERDFETSACGAEEESVERIDQQGRARDFTLLRNHGVGVGEAERLSGYREEDG